MEIDLTTGTLNLVMDVLANTFYHYAERRKAIKSALSKFDGAYGDHIRETVRSLNQALDKVNTRGVELQETATDILGKLPDSLHWESQSRLVLAAEAFDKT